MNRRTLAFFSAMILFATVTISIQAFAQNTQPSSASQTDPKAQARILDQYGKLPLSFEANHGQTDTRVKFLSRTSGYTLFLTGDEAVLTLRGRKTNTKAKIPRTDHTLQSSTTVPRAGGVLRMKFRNANPAAKVTGIDELPGTSNYFIGNDPKKWCRNVPTYSKVKYEGIYSGIDLVYYGNQKQIEYDFVVAPGTDLSRIRLKFRGAGKLRIDDKGDLVFGAAVDEVRLQKPQVYQETSGTRKIIEGRYRIAAANTIGFRVADYDRSKPLIIDPVLDYSTYLGGNGADEGNSVALDSSGNVYVTGLTDSTNFPTTTAAFQTTLGYGGPFNVFVAKLNATGSALVYSTYLGGSREVTQGYGIAVDSSGNAYVTGLTESSDFPTTTGAFQTTFGATANAFVTKLNATGSALVYSTYLGGNEADFGFGIAVDSAGNAYVTGLAQSTNFPTTTGAFQTTGNGSGQAFVTKLTPTGSALVYSTYLGGSGDDSGSAIAVDGSGNAYVSGDTSSTNFPTTTAAFQTTFGGGLSDAFVTKLNATGSALVYSTYLGGSDDDQGNGIAVDGSGNAYVSGGTSSTNFPTTTAAFQTTLRGGLRDAFVTKLSPTGSALVYSTYLGGSGDDSGSAIAVDGSGNAYVSGGTSSTNFPTVNALQSTFGGGTYDAFVTEIDRSGSALVYSTYLGGRVVDYGDGIAVDASGKVYVTGYTFSPNFRTANAIQSSLRGTVNAFVASIGPYSVCLLYDSTKAVHSGATIPIKLQLCDSSGNDLSSSNITVHAISVSQISTSTSGAVEDSGNSNPNDDFRFDSTLGSTGGYICNLKTTGLSTGTYTVNFTVTGDPFVYAAGFEVK
jgi:Beta-propeller repeat